MRRWTIVLSVLLLVIVVVLIIMFTGDQAGEITSTSGASTTTTVQGTTTSGDQTTTTAGETTTSTSGTTTTASPGGLEGNWAEAPLVVASFGALGWWDGGGWVQVDEGTSLPIVGGEDYQIALYGVDGITTGGGEELVCEVLLLPGVILEDEGLLGAFPGPIGVAISAPWVLTPHLVEQTEDDGTHTATAAGLLAERGLDVANPPIKQVFRLDLEGDGVNEVLVVSEDVSDGLLAEEGDYSIVFLRRVVDGAVQTTVVAESVILELGPTETPYVESYTIAAIADFNGDGRMEIVVDIAYYEGIGVVAFEYVDDDIGTVPQIGTGCGS